MDQGQHHQWHHEDMYLPQTPCMSWERHFTSVVFFPKIHNEFGQTLMPYYYEVYSWRKKMSNTPKKTWPVPQNCQFYKIKKAKNSPTGQYWDMTTKCNVLSWIEFWHRKENSWKDWWNLDKAWSLVYSNMTMAVSYFWQMCHGHIKWGHRHN